MQLSEMLDSGADTENREIRDLDVIFSFHPLFPIVISKNAFMDEEYHAKGTQIPKLISLREFIDATKEECLHPQAHANTESSSQALPSRQQSVIRGVGTGPRTEVAEVGDVNIAAEGCGVAESNTQFEGRKYSGAKSFSTSSQIDSVIGRRDKDDRRIEGKPVTTGTQSVELDIKSVGWTIRVQTGTDSDETKHISSYGTSAT
ncbi:hypothetical protein EDB84DRAFT_1440950 [Lactarius hengduanensis]|nr:hypothetical protein EDB84DRAFT_1440950 [Lactarius hengduanensis]